MYKHLLILFHILLFHAVIMGQEFHGGISLGACGTQVDGDTHSGYDKSGITGGAVVKYPINERVTFQTEIKYFPKGSRVKASEEQGRYISYQIALHYIEMPYILSYQFKLLINNKQVNLSIEGGLGLGYLVSGKEEEMGYEINGDLHFKKFEFSGMYGLNYHINKNFIVNAKYHYSLLPIRRFPHDINPRPDRIIFNKGQYNNVISFSVYFVI